MNTDIQIENRSQEIHQELSLSEITAIALRNWPLFLVLLVVTLGIGISFYAWKNPYVAKTTIIINDNQNSQLQAFSQSLAGNAKTNEAKKSNSTAQKNLEYFRTTDFLKKIIQASSNQSLNAQLTLAEKSGQMQFREIIGTATNLEGDEKILLMALQKLDALLKFKVKSDYEIEISAINDQRELALYTTNLVAQVALQSLQQKESSEIQALNDFLIKEKSLVDQELADLNKKMAQFNDKPENLMALSSREKVGEYLSELMVRKNETTMKISENNKIMQALSASSGQRRESQLYGNNGRVQSLKLENDLLRTKLGQIQSAIDRVSQDAKGMPYAAQMYDELKKRSDIQLTRFKELSESITKVEALKLAAANKYEMLEKARLDKVAPAIALWVVVFLAILATQVLGSLIIYLRAIWNSNVVTAEATRNVVVLDSHSLDPRVIIENSKIRFRLRSNTMTDVEEISDPEQGQNKKLGFNFNTKDQNG